MAIDAAITSSTIVNDCFAIERASTVSMVRGLDTAACGSSSATIRVIGAMSVIGSPASTLTTRLGYRTYDHRGAPASARVGKYTISSGDEVTPALLRMSSATPTTRYQAVDFGPPALIPLPIGLSSGQWCAANALLTTMAPSPARIPSHVGLFPSTRVPIASK